MVSYLLKLECRTLSRTPCGFCFVEYYSHAEALACLRYISGTKLDERIIRCDLDLGYRDGRQFGRGKSGGQVRRVSFLAHWYPDYGVSRSEMSTDKIMTLVVEGGVLKRNLTAREKWRNGTMTRRTYRGLWLEEEAIGRKPTMWQKILSNGRGLRRMKVTAEEEYVP